MTFFSIVFAIIKAIPSLKSWWDEFTAWYVAREIANMKKELSEAIYAASKTDQRNLEKFIGSGRAGLPSGENGSVIVPSLPNVPKLPKSK